MLPLEHLTVRALPQHLFRPQLKQIRDRPELGRPVEPHHPQVTFLRRLQKKHAFVYLRQLYLYLPIFDSLDFFVGEET
jgi:hypothetical protein